MNERMNFKQEKMVEHEKIIEKTWKLVMDIASNVCFLNLVWSPSIDIQFKTNPRDLAKGVKKSYRF